MRWLTFPELIETEVDATIVQTSKVGKYSVDVPWAAAAAMHHAENGNDGYSGAVTDKTSPLVAWHMQPARKHATQVFIAFKLNLHASPYQYLPRLCSSSISASYVRAYAIMC